MLKAFSTLCVLKCTLERGKHVFIDSIAQIAQLGERQTEDLKVPGSIPGLGRIFQYAL